MTKIEIL